MIKYFSALFCALLVLSLLDPIQCGRFGGGSRGGGSRGGSHSYPSSHGLSGGSRHTGSHSYPSSGSHGYPSSGGLSGSGSHGYPSSGGLSGGGSHGYPSSGGLSGGGSHGYPSSGSSYPSNKYPSVSGGHTYPSSSGGHNYPSSSGGHNYPSSSGGHSYPSSGSGLSGSSHGSKPRYPTTHTTHTTVHHHHYNYVPPPQITYAAPGHRPMHYPVYHGTPPTYVYQYQNSGSKYGTLLTGLALLNLGTLAGSVYANSHNRQTYKAQPGEACRFAVKKSNGDYEETKIDCMLMSSFIYEEEAKAASGKTGTNTTIVSTTVTNVTVVNTTNTGPAPAVPAPTTTEPPPVMTPLYQMLPNGTLVPVNMTYPAIVNATIPNTNVTSNILPNGTVATGDGSGSVSLTPNGTVTSSVTSTTTMTNTTVVNALDVKGKDIEVTPGMECFLIRTTPSSRMKKHIPCGLLQSYARQSLHRRNTGVRNLPTYTILFAIAAFVLY